MQARIQLWSATDSSHSQHALLCMSSALRSQVAAVHGCIRRLKDGEMAHWVSWGKNTDATHMTVCECAARWQCYTFCILTPGHHFLNIFIPSLTFSHLSSSALAYHTFAFPLHSSFTVCLSFIFLFAFTNARTCLSILKGKSSYVWNAGRHKRNSIIYSLG